MISINTPKGRFNQPNKPPNNDTTPHRRLHKGETTQARPGRASPRTSHHAFNTSRSDHLKRPCSHCMTRCTIPGEHTTLNTENKLPSCLPLTGSVEGAIGKNASEACMQGNSPRCNPVALASSPAKTKRCCWWCCCDSVTRTLPDGKAQTHASATVSHKSRPIPIP